MGGTVFRAIAAGLALLLVTACGGRTKEEIVEKARDLTTRTELEQALGRPDDIAKLGPVERWTYRASNGTVVFIVVGETVTLQAAGGPAEPRK